VLALQPDVPLAVSVWRDGSTVELVSTRSAPKDAP